MQEARLGFVFEFQLFPHLLSSENLALSPVKTMGEAGRMERRQDGLLEQLRTRRTQSPIISGGQNIGWLWRVLY